MAKKKYNNYQAPYNTGVETTDESLSDNTEKVEGVVEETVKDDIVEKDTVSKETEATDSFSPTDFVTVKKSEDKKAVTSPIEKKQEINEKIAEDKKSATKIVTDVEGVKPIITLGRKINLYKTPIYKTALSSTITGVITGSYFIIGINSASDRCKISTDNTDKNFVGFIDNKHIL